MRTAGARSGVPEPIARSELEPRKIPGGRGHVVHVGDARQLDLRRDRNDAIEPLRGQIAEPGALRIRAIRGRVREWVVRVAQAILRWAIVEAIRAVAPARDAAD